MDRKSQGVSNLVSSSQATMAKGKSKSWEVWRTKCSKKDTNTRQIKNEYSLTSQSSLLYGTYSAGVFLSLPAWHEPKLKQEDVFHNADFFPLIPSHYWYQPWVTNTIKRLSTRMKLEVKIGQAKLMGGGKGHWILGEFDMIDLTGKKKAEKPRRDAIGQWGERNSKGGLLSAWIHA